MFALTHRRATDLVWVAATTIVVFGLVSCAAFFEPDRSARAPRLEGFGAPVPLQAGSQNAEARELFGRGVLQAYAFNENEAVRLFKAALAQDPACALCAWGVAWQLGPNINAPQREDLKEARLYAGLALRHAQGATPLARELIDAMGLRYGVNASPAAAQASPLQSLPGAEICSAKPGAARADPLDTAYAARMRALADAHPGDADVLSFYAEAEMVATRDDWWDARTGRPGGRIGEVATRIEQALPAAPNHTGLNHYLIHALDSGPGAARAVAAADRLGALAPASPHLVHMPSHIFVRVGRYADASAVNQRALAEELKLTAAVQQQGFEPSKNWDRHNLHFLWFAALMQGRGDLTLDTSRRIAQLVATSTSPFGAYRRGLPILTLTRLERWPEVLAEPLPKADEGPLASALSHHARGMAFARTGQGAFAAEQAKALDQDLAATEAAARGKTDDDAEPTVAQAVRVLHGVLRAELDAVAGDLPGARARLVIAIEAEDKVGGEPAMLASMSRLALGDLLLRQGRAAEAETAYRDELARQPGSGWALRGVARALATQGREADADRARMAVATAWNAADLPLR